MRKGLIVKKLKGEKKIEKGEIKEIWVLFSRAFRSGCSLPPKKQRDRCRKGKGVFLHAYPHHFIISS